jgi:hypothetical protein
VSTGGAILALLISCALAAAITLATGVNAWGAAAIGIACGVVVPRLINR